MIRLGFFAAILLALVQIGACTPADKAVDDSAASDTSEGGAHPGPNAVASADSVIVFYDDRGAGDLAVVLVHGWNCDRDYWQLQRDYLAERYRVVSVDLAGHGESASNREQWSIGAFGDDVAAVVEKLDLGSVVLVGHSMGGAVVLEAALTLGDRVRHVIGVDTLRGIDKPPTRATVDGWLASLSGDYTGTVTELVEMMFVPDSNPRVRDFVVRDMASAPKDVSIASLLAFLEYNPVPAIDVLKAPLTIINSDYRTNDVAAIRERVEKFELIEMNDVGHFIMLEDPTAFTEHLSRTLAAVNDKL